MFRDHKQNIYIVQDHQRMFQTVQVQILLLSGTNKCYFYSLVGIHYMLNGFLETHLTYSLWLQRTKVIHFVLHTAETIRTGLTMQDQSVKNNF